MDNLPSSQGYAQFDGDLHQQELCRGQVMVVAPPSWWPDRALVKPLTIDALGGQPLIGITVSDALGNNVAKPSGPAYPVP